MESCGGGDRWEQVSTSQKTRGRCGKRRGGVLVVFCAELDCGKLWRRRSLGAGVYQPEDSWGVREWLREEKRRRRFLEDFYCSRLCDSCVVRERLREEKRRRGFLLRSESDVGAERAALRTKFGSFLARN